ncbi:hypothetical protein ACFQVD_26295 [Streptosporangium amethystogenes subsp. fukuiense]|uniref:Uncharacterized protein n=1 Tax=Streptosporangium amethystogenes subsp. fukuiense TaxID=698418 RepID=A0ABW2T5I1_9ACTN
MIIQGWLDPETAAHQFIAAFPGFREAVEAAATRTAEQLDGSVATRKRQRQAFADFFRFYLVDELTFRGVLACDGDEKDTVEIRAGNRNGLSLKYHSVRIRCLRSKDGRAPGASSRKRAREYTQPLFPIELKSLTLLLLWEITAKGVEMELVYPKASGEKSKHTTVHWAVPIPHPAESLDMVGVDAGVVDIAAAQDLDEYVLLKQDVKEEGGESS